MNRDDVLVSICLPVRNPSERILFAARSALSQDHTNIELVISDNASSDDTEQICLELSRRDERVSYHRNSEDVGILGNFVKAMHRANGRYIRWMSDDDTLRPNCISRCLDQFDADPRLILVTSQLSYTHPDGTECSGEYSGTALRSSNSLERFGEMLRLLNAGQHTIDPLYGLFRRDAVINIDRHNMLREDQIFATKVALVGPWGHVPEILAQRHWKHESTTSLAPRLGVPAWQAHFATTLQCWEMLRFVAGSDLETGDLASARMAIARFYARRQMLVSARRVHKLTRHRALPWSRQLGP